MNFRWKEQARDWFRHLSNNKTLFKTNFDFYYICLMLGLASGRTNSLSEGVDLTDEFVTDYKEQQRIIIGLLLRAELARFGLDIKDKSSIRTCLQQLLDPSSTNKLTSAGMSALNEYASGGFDLLVENIHDKPRNGPEFLITYNRILQSAIQTNPNWIIQSLST